MDFSIFVLPRGFFHPRDVICIHGNHFWMILYPWILFRFLHFICVYDALILYHMTNVQVTCKPILFIGGGDDGFFSYLSPQRFFCMHGMFFALIATPF